MKYHPIVSTHVFCHEPIPFPPLTPHPHPFCIPFRFLSQFKALKQFFYSSGNLQYFKTLIQVPSLSELPPNFLLQTGSFVVHEFLVVVVVGFQVLV